MSGFRSTFLLLIALTFSVSAFAASPPCLSMADRLRAITAPIPSEFHEEHATFSQITTEDNLNFVKTTANDTGGKHIILNLEFSNLKAVNDEIIGNKTFTNALANAYKKNVLEFLTDVEQNPKLSENLVAKYSDYKSVRLAFKKGDPEIESLLEKFSQDAADRYHHDVEALQLQDLYKDSDGISRQPMTWHLAGIGETVSQARAAATYSEQFNQNLPIKLHVSNFKDIEPELKKSIIHMQTVAENLSKNEAILKAGLLVPSQTPGKNILSLKAMNLLKKSATPEIFREKVLEILGVTLTPSEAKDMANWYHTVDTQFSPGITQIERVSVHSVKAKFGVIAVDYRSLSLRKNTTPMEAIAAATDPDPKEVLVATDKFFEADHERLIAQHHLIATKLAKKPEYIYSGDELFLLPDHYLSETEKKNFIEAVSKDPEANHIRTGFSTIQDPSFRSQVIAKGDKLETATREQLLKSIPYDDLVRVNMGMNFEQDARGVTYLRPIVSERYLTAEQKILVQKAMDENVPKYVSGIHVLPIEFVEPPRNSVPIIKQTARAVYQLSKLPAQQSGPDGKAGADASQ